MRVPESRSHLELGATANGDDERNQTDLEIWLLGLESLPGAVKESGCLVEKLGMVCLDQDNGPRMVVERKTISGQSPPLWTRRNTRLNKGVAIGKCTVPNKLKIIELCIKEFG
nr:hypothetical protein Iba_chr14fCG0250 [Ipomoea batatas]